MFNAMKWRLCIEMNNMYGSSQPLPLILSRIVDGDRPAAESVAVRLAMAA